jgi:hypothetical protein
MGHAIGRLPEFLRELAGSIEVALFYSIKTAIYNHDFANGKILAHGSFGLPDESVKYFDLF